MDPAVLAGNVTDTIDPTQEVGLSISNEANLGHHGAQRASGKVIVQNVSDPAISLLGLEIGETVDPGESETAAIRTAGLPAGHYSGTISLTLQDSQAEGQSINYANAYPFDWDYDFTLGQILTDSAFLDAGDNYRHGDLGINNSTAIVALSDGISHTSQNIFLAFTDTPPAGGPPPVTDAFDLTFELGSDLYVVEIAYDEDNLPGGASEEDLRIYSFDTGSGQWVEAVAMNSDNGTPPSGAAPYHGSYADFLASIGGGTLEDTDLSAFGIDSAGNVAWGIYDHSTTFRLVAPGTTPAPPPVILGLDYHRATNMVTITYQSETDVVFGVRGGTDLQLLDPLPDTSPGDGSVKQYTHYPPGNPAAYFYQFTRN